MLCRFGRCPDIILMSSALWDINRYGPDALHPFKRNMVDLMELLQKHLSSRTQVMFLTQLSLNAVQYILFFRKV